MKRGSGPPAVVPVAVEPPGPLLPLRIVTHHWSNNPLKGFDVYEQEDDLLAAGELPGLSS